jgi:aubergine
VKAGSVIFDELAKNNTMDFHLVSQHVENQDGTSAPTQYRIAYRNRFHLSEGALAQFTFEQCFNYYNWAGSVRIPAPLQCAVKLSKLVGESVQQNVTKVTNEDRERFEQKLEESSLASSKLTSDLPQMSL